MLFSLFTWSLEAQRLITLKWRGKLWVADASLTPLDSLGGNDVYAKLLLDLLTGTNTASTDSKNNSI